MRTYSTQQKTYFILRLAVAMCFIGHGAFGIITKPIWANYFAVFGIGHDTAYQLMPVVGTIDILLGLVMLFYPIRTVAGWLVLWGLMTAMLRPLSGEPFAEFIERAGNYGAPLALLVLCGADSKIKSWFKLIDTHKIAGNEQQLKQLTLVLRTAVFLLLCGHGWLNLMDKKGLLQQYESLGFHNPQQVALTVGLFEVFAALTVLIKPARSILIIFLIWKAGSELFYPHYELFEWVERGGSYGCILALWMVLRTEDNMIHSAVKHPLHFKSN
ncbi:DoxX family membrane protein [Mucilaginibacter sp. KACC 22063]|uniref:DoxX family membrane protein n=1 Tax=Mucilaginibacter sp. KACC 22063 TaxID=3025666 RepID=UPI002365302F|nr:DoxX family membrane protein [Mucilaginibacter sp. KACC 22063]WDF54972.1 hypothetical protein PQ461_18755 [Mucilaginibacter sp. KACC 22063]